MRDVVFALGEHEVRAVVADDAHILDPDPLKIGLAGSRVQWTPSFEVAWPRDMVAGWSSS